jgi:hypothetical protein
MELRIQIPGQGAPLGSSGWVDDATPMHGGAFGHLRGHDSFAEFARDVHRGRGLQIDYC